jgi:hypothetical protein
LLANPTDTAAAKRALVRTYNPPAYADPWDCVEDFERVQQEAAKHPNKGSAALASVVDLPRGRIRPWMEGARPDCYRGLQVALEHDWLLESWDSDTARALNELAAWVCASGSIDSNFAAYFVVEPALVDRFQQVAADANLSVRRTRDDPDRPPEWTPTEHQTVFGRVLHTWTGVQGDKSALATQFPRYPQFAPDDIAAVFAATYVRLRASETDRYDGPAVTLQEDRSKRYYRNLRSLLERVVEDPDEIRGSGFPVYIVGEAAQQLYFDAE